MLIESLPGFGAVMIALVLGDDKIDFFFGAVFERHINGMSTGRNFQQRKRGGGGIDSLADRVRIVVKIELVDLTANDNPDLRAKQYRLVRRRDDSLPFRKRLKRLRRIC